MNYNCLKCGYISDRKSNFMRHITSNNCKKIENAVDLNLMLETPNNIFIDPDSNNINLERGNRRETTMHILNYDNWFKNPKNCNTCPFCLKEFSRRGNVNKHIKKNCKMKLSLTIEQLNNISNNITNSTANSYNTNSFNTTNNNITNNNITNNIQIITFGKEDLCNVLSKKEQRKILGRNYNSLIELIEYIHCNKKYPQFRNIMITNLKDKIAYKHDEKENKFKAVDEDEFLDEVIQVRICDIEDFKKINENELNPSNLKIINDFVYKITSEDEETINRNKKGIKFSLYNFNQK